MYVSFNMVQVTRNTKFTAICIGLYVSYAIFVFFLLPMLRPDPVSMYRTIVAYQTRHLGNLSNYTMAEGGQPILSMLVTMRGSGALSLLNNLSHQPGCYHHYAPLVAYQCRFSAEQHAEQALEELISSFNCNYKLSGQSMFTTVYNLRLKYLATLLERKDLNIRILLLVRDPRGTMYSRSDWNWCIGKPHCDDPSNLCKDMVSDYVVARKLIKNYPQSFGIVRYEDLAERPAKVLQQVFDFYGVPLQRKGENLPGHPRSNDLDDKSMPAFEWLTQLSEGKIKAIEDAPNCKEAMQMWGYRSINSVKDVSADTFHLMMGEPTFFKNKHAVY